MTDQFAPRFLDSSCLHQNAWKSALGGAFGPAAAVTHCLPHKSKSGTSIFSLQSLEPPLWSRVDPKVRPEKDHPHLVHNEEVASGNAAPVVHPQYARSLLVKRSSVPAAVVLELVHLEGQPLGRVVLAHRHVLHAAGGRVDLGAVKAKVRPEGVYLGNWSSITNLADLHQSKTILCTVCTS